MVGGASHCLFRTLTVVNAQNGAHCLDKGKLSVRHLPNKVTDLSLSDIYMY